MPCTIKLSTRAICAIGVLARAGRAAIAAMITAAALVGPAFAQAACPVINGVYEMNATLDGVPKILSQVMFTRVERGVFSYTVSKDVNTGYQVADGNWRPFQSGGVSGKLRYTCIGNNTLQKDTVSDDGKLWGHFKYTLIDEKHLRYESAAKERNGVYKWMSFTRSSK